MLLPVLLSLLSVFARAAAADKPVLLDFEAPWCYSCYFMNERVLSKEGFKIRAEAFQLKKVDVDTPEGRKLKAEHKVTFLPSYLLLGSDGKERGRIIGEQVESEFLAKLDKLLGGKSLVDEKREKLRAKLAKGDMDAYRALLVMHDCETPYDVMKALPHIEKLYPESAQHYLKMSQSAMANYYSGKIQVEGRERCADYRSGVEVFTTVLEKLKMNDVRDRVLARSITQVAGWAKTGEDRNRDDVLRFLLEKAGKDAELREHFKALIAAYPSDYVYAHRFARYLHERGENAEALVHAEAADRLCYGANRLSVTKYRAKILAALGRKDEALALLARDAKAGKTAFPTEAAALEKLSAELSKAG